jgi:hypothetical protein
MTCGNVSNYSDPNLNLATKRAYRDFANNYEFDFSVTFTFRNSITDERAYWYFREFFSKLQKKAFGKNALKAIRNNKFREVAIQFGLEDDGQNHFHLRIRAPERYFFKKGFDLKKETVSIWREVTRAEQINIQEHYFKKNGESFYDYSVKKMGVSYNDYDELYWDD